MSDTESISIYTEDPATRAYHRDLEQPDWPPELEVYRVPAGWYARISAPVSGR